MNLQIRRSTRALMATRSTKRVLALVSLLAVGACSGGGGQTRSALPPAPTGAKLSGNALATLRIVIPARPAGTSSTARRVQYISYATQSIKAVFTPSGGSATTFTQNLTPTSPGCQGSLNSSTTCTLALSGLAPGSYTATFTMYDGTLDGNNQPTGNVLSANQSVPVAIVAGQANVIAVTLAGVPVALAIVPGPRRRSSGNQSRRLHGFEMLGLRGGRHGKSPWSASMLTRTSSSDQERRRRD